ncbi:MAG: futalosine hydrolase [Thermodesulfobacteriota bacterium]|nr:futalosine hydrolase [Thermodesulfobacteriota bacterium]
MFFIVYLVAGSTELEINLLRREVSAPGKLDFLVTGVGPVESAISLTKFLEREQADGVILFGVGGAYTEKEVDVLDICLAEEERFGDSGIAMDDDIHYFSDEMLTGKQDFDLRNSLSDQVESKLMALGMPFKKGPFVTVHACSGTLKRGNVLRDKFNAICENMEGAAMARVCELYGVPLLELRCISNMVEDRDTSGWKIKEAVAKGAGLLGRLLPELLQ